jgi:hypothetical protein
MSVFPFMPPLWAYDIISDLLNWPSSADDVASVYGTEISLNTFITGGRWEFEIRNPGSLENFASFGNVIEIEDADGVIHQKFFDVESVNYDVQGNLATFIIHVSDSPAVLLYILYAAVAAGLVSLGIIGVNSVLVNVRKLGETPLGAGIGISLPILAGLALLAAFGIAKEEKGN